MKVMTDTEHLREPRRTIAMIASALVGEFAIVGLRQYGVIKPSAPPRNP